MAGKPRALEEWLQAKLDDPWGGDNISTLLTADQLNEIASRWFTFDSQIRVKILIGKRLKCFMQLNHMLVFKIMQAARARLHVFVHARMSE